MQQLFFSFFYLLLFLVYLRVGLVLSKLHVCFVSNYIQLVSLYLRHTLGRQFILASNIKFSYNITLKK